MAFNDYENFVKKILGAKTIDHYEDFGRRK